MSLMFRTVLKWKVKVKLLSRITQCHGIISELAISLAGWGSQAFTTFIQCESCNMFCTEEISCLMGMWFRSPDFRFKSYVMLCGKMATVGLIGTLLENKSSWNFFFLRQKGQYKHKSWTPINSPCKRSSKASACLFPSASEMTECFQTALGSAFFQCQCMLVLPCPVKYIILKCPTGHLLATMFLAVLHPWCPDIKST